MHFYVDSVASRLLSVEEEDAHSPTRRELSLSGNAYPLPAPPGAVPRRSSHHPPVHGGGALRLRKLRTGSFGTRGATSVKDCVTLSRRAMLVRRCSMAVAAPAVWLMRSSNDVTVIHAAAIRSI